MKYQCYQHPPKRISIGIGGKYLLLLFGNPVRPDEVHLLTDRLLSQISFGENSDLDEIQKQLGDFLIPKEEDYSEYALGDLLRSEFFLYKKRLFKASYG